MYSIKQKNIRILLKFTNLNAKVANYISKEFYDTAKKSEYNDSPFLMDIFPQIVKATKIKSSVKADEFRDGVKIGQARRDFQMLVVDGCNPPDPPEALVLVPGKNEFYSEDDMKQYSEFLDKENY